MTYTVHLHPLSSYCWKLLLAFYDTGVPFESITVNLGDQSVREAYLKLSPLGKIPSLQDHARDSVINETSIQIEYLALNEPAARRLLPTDAAAALPVRELDRWMDNYVMHPMQKIVTDKIRPQGQGDTFGVARARRDLAAALDILERVLPKSGWACGDAFTMADCAAAPSLFYADKVLPFAGTHPNVHAYLKRLEARPSFVRVLKEAAPFFAMFPG